MPTRKSAQPRAETGAETGAETATEATTEATTARALAARSIALAEAAAGNDDARFVQVLENNLRAAANPAAAPGSRARAVIPIAADPHPQRSFQMHRDPRYLANARLLARRTGGGFRVIGGEVVPLGEFLDCVAVGNDQEWGCTGTLIAANVVVTAGHCTEFAIRIYIGRDVSKKGTVVKVAQRVRHPQYNIKGHNDLMVLILAQPVAGVTPRALAGKTVIDKASDGRVVGFGHTNSAGTLGYGVKRYVDVPIVSGACKGTADGQQDTNIYGCDKSQELVAGRPLAERDSCKGDSGGPFYVPGAQGQWLLAGATSRATTSAMSNCGDGGIYVRMDRYKAWINSLPGVKLP